MAFNTICLIAGSANPQLAREISNRAKIRLGEVTLKRFSDGEVFVQIEENVRGSSAFVIQPTCAPVNDNLMELLVLIDALKRASVESITAVVPYYGYSRQDRKAAPRTPISAKLVADLLQAAGVDRMVALDLHAGQIQGFFDVPFDNLYGLNVIATHMKEQLRDEVVIVSPDAGGVARARAFAKQLHANLAIIDKRRPKANQSEVMNIIGEVKGCDCIIVDDMVDTAGTLTNSAKALVDAGAKRVMAAATHGVLSGPAIERLKASVLEKLIVTDTIPHSDEEKRDGRIEVVSCASLLAEAIKRIHTGDSVSSLFG
ncbi:MAG: ribose-phosphate pyrophosphokinase [Proteobacteria bacterium]|jgi:ribose-phosphate pyrophosphokinase|nr:ribose-phosphate pyrophosphokinase [Pseudomonadota bacterium]